MNKFSAKKGFTLPEVIVAMTVLSLVIFTATNLVVQIIRSNTQNIDTMVAYGLAQEGLEGMRNIRDSNWLLGAEFNGDLGQNVLNQWGAVLPQQQDEVRFYKIDLDKLDSQPNVIDRSSRSSVANGTPWRLQQIDVSEEPAPNSAETVLYKYELQGNVRYEHDLLAAPDREESKYHRYLVVQNISDESNVTNKYRAMSVVTWEDAGRARTVRLSTELTDWNQGQL